MGLVARIEGQRVTPSLLSPHFLPSPKGLALYAAPPPNFEEEEFGGADEVEEADDEDLAPEKDEVEEIFGCR